MDWPIGITFANTRCASTRSKTMMQARVCQTYHSSFSVLCSGFGPRPIAGGVFGSRDIISSHLPLRSATSFLLCLLDHSISRGTPNHYAGTPPTPLFTSLPLLVSWPNAPSSQSPPLSNHRRSPLNPSPSIPQRSSHAETLLHVVRCMETWYLHLCISDVECLITGC